MSITPNELATICHGKLDGIVSYWGKHAPQALVLQQEGLSLTWQQTADAVQQSAESLLNAGVRAGDRVVIVGENCIEQIILIFALARINAWSVSVNARLSPSEVDAIRTHCGARLCFYTTTVSSDASQHAQRHGASPYCLAGLSQIAISALNEQAVPEEVPNDTSKQVAVLVYTTGTTGHPKGVMLTHRNLLFIAEVSSRLRDLNQNDHVYGVLPISHVYGLASVMLGTLFVGAALHVASRYDPADVINAITNQHLTVLQGVPVMYKRLLEYLGDAPPPHMSLRFMYAGGSPLDLSLKQKVEQKFQQTLHNGYGLTESSPTISQTRLDAPRTDDSVGQLIPGIACRFVDSEGKDVAPGETGELWVRGPNVMLGYYKEPELTKSVMREGDWLNTGDLAYCDPDGAMFIVGRTKEVIIRSGFNVYPTEVEAALNLYPGIVQSAVVGRSCSDGNEEVVAFIEAKSPKDIDIDAVRKHLEGKLAAYKRPCEIIVKDKLPAASTGKLLKGTLKEMAKR